MRKVEIRGYVVYDPEEVCCGSRDGDAVCRRIEDGLFNEDFPREWSFEPVSDTDIDYAEDDE